jgi:2,4-dienoyl-CoA reductase-like NADH-dependent reductase (Old Yellow Enzyme family)
VYLATELEERMSDDPLLSPLRIKHLTLRNRIMSTAHEPNYSEGGLPKDRYRLYHVERAKGGIALTMTAGSAIVSADSPPAFGNLHAYRDEIVPWIKRLTDGVKEHGAAIMIQLTHLGRRTGWNRGDWLPVLAPSPIREPAHRAFPKEMEDWDIERIITDYADAAERMRAGGMDGIELECYGHLIDGFWSPATNMRTDEYGGSLDNRLRFVRLVLEAIRGRLGTEFIVGLRLVADEERERGISREEGIEICRRMVATGQIDFLNVIRGHIDHDAPLSKVIPIHGMASAPHLAFAGEVRAATRFPVFHAARIPDAATARHAVREGKLDMVGMTRAHLADPHIVNKIRSKLEHTIRPCVGATYCLDRIYEGNDALCIHNAATGREEFIPHVVAKRQGPALRIVVVGAGPAGLEAARIAAERGHEVAVLEAQPLAGGQVRLLAQSPRRRELLGIVVWRLAELERLGVAVEYNVLADAEGIMKRRPDVVIVATGGLPQPPLLTSGTEFTVSSWDIISGEIAPAREVLLYDDNGAHPGMQAAEAIALAGSTLEVVSPERFFAPELGGLNHVPYARVFCEKGVRVTINSTLVSVAREGNRLLATIGSPYGRRTESRLVDQVVVEHGTAPLADVYFDLKHHSANKGAANYPTLTSPALSHGMRVFRIGDAVSSRNVHAAIYDAVRLAASL